jgi:hypothetical protein
MGSRVIRGNLLVIPIENSILYVSPLYLRAETGQLPELKRVIAAYGRRFRCTLRVDCGQLDPGGVIRPVPGEWQPRTPERLDEEELADWRAGRDAVYQLAALTIGARLAVADA